MERSHSTPTTARSPATSTSSGERARPTSTSARSRRSQRAGWNVQARNPASTYGYVFVDSKLTADPGVTGQGLGRIDDSVYPASHVAYVNCTMGRHIAPAGWTITGGASTSQLRFWEYQSVDPSGAPIDVSQRVAGSTQISASVAQSMRDSDRGARGLAATVVGPARAGVTPGNARGARRAGSWPASMGRARRRSQTQRLSAARGARSPRRAPRCSRSGRTRGT